ncbi:hypothetical protein [Alkalitalea saponilacus]|uniref:Uncharacterized protein n=1 Tax=Alkalitalea saponilacus TaxID=889453 RepID=A0A1T5A215_9BACT|nr:hypothetical protein [Alkalitalea saponilacus]ASB48899.1 hypothetical protein CDL62_07000 [Alkalitalea saponilacus]SKB29018.1 hypothetical protein SAMN03080601_00037 [Alkalitalea saponilacus]
MSYTSDRQSIKATSHKSDFLNFSGFQFEAYFTEFAGEDDDVMDKPYSNNSDAGFAINDLKQEV